jgi:outer membrane protein
MNRLMMLAVTTVCAAAQDGLTLKDAVRQALSSHPAQQAAQASTDAAGARLKQARSGYYPRVTFSEYFQTSNQPVFAFGSLLNQRRFAQNNFALDALNRPGFTNNFRTQISGEQTLWDFGTTAAGVRSASLSRDIAEEDRRLSSQRRIALVAQAYHAVTLAGEAQRVAEAAVRSAEADLLRAEAVRDAGRSTDADVLSVRVHLAAMREREIRSRYDAQVALAALNEAMGAPLDTARQLATALTPAADAPSESGERPELRQARLAVDLGESRRIAAARAYLPKVVAQVVFEADRGRFVTRGGANWLFATGLQWNLWDASTRGKIEEAEAGVAAARAREREVAAQVSLEQRQAQARLAAAREQLAAASASVAEAEESARILRNRYEAGLARIDELLRNELALLEARMRNLTAAYNHRMAAVEVELAAGSLTEDSHVLD